MQKHTKKKTVTADCEYCHLSDICSGINPPLSMSGNCNAFTHNCSPADHKAARRKEWEGRLK